MVFVLQSAFSLQSSWDYVSIVYDYDQPGQTEQINVSNTFSTFYGHYVFEIFDMVSTKIENWNSVRNG